MSNSHHLDSPSGKQYHVRYEPSHDPGRIYWSAVIDNPEEAQRALEIFSSIDPDAKLFVRYVSPWRERELDV